MQAIAFLDTSNFTALFVVKYRERMAEGLLPLRAIKEGDEEASDLPILKEWKAARALLSRIRTGAAPFLGGQAATLGKAWVETLPPGAHTPWTKEEGEYADSFLRTRTCLVPAPGAWSYAGGSGLCLPVGSLHLVDPRSLASEINVGEHARTHLIVDIRRPEPAADET